MQPFLSLESIFTLELGLKGKGKIEGKWLMFLLFLA
jgi:hypothetical protein